MTNYSGKQMEDLIKNMISKREELGWSKKDLAVRLGVSVSSISNWESGISFPNFNNQLKIMKYIVHEDNDSWAKRLLDSKEKNKHHRYKKNVDKLYGMVVPLAESLKLDVSYIDYFIEEQCGRRTDVYEISDLVLRDLQKDIFLYFNCLCEDEPAIVYLSSKNSNAKLLNNKSVFYLTEDRNPRWVLQSGNGCSLKVDDDVFKILLEEVFFA